jgi:hypothetical protein
VRAELAPAGALEADLVTRVVTAAWRARRVDRLEVALLGRCLPEAHVTDLRECRVELGFGLMRDGNGPRALETLVRYRGSVLAELFRALAALEALRNQARDLWDAAPALLEATPPKPHEFEKQSRNNDLGFAQLGVRVPGSRLRIIPQ